MSETNQPMSKWVPITIIAVLVVAFAATAAVMGTNIGSLNGKLNRANSESASLQTQVESLQREISSLQTQLTQAQGQTSTVQSSLAAANAQITALSSNLTAQQDTIAQQAGQIKTMSYPRNFSSLVELTNWLQLNNPTAADPLSLTPLQKTEMAFVLEIKAARDGYLLPVTLPLLGNLDTVTNRTVIANVVYDVRASDNFVQIGGTVVPALPSYPIPPGSGQ